MNDDSQDFLHEAWRRTNGHENVSLDSGGMKLLNNKK